MVGSIRSWAQAILLVGTIAALAPFLHVGGTAGQTERAKTVSDQSMSVSPEPVEAAAAGTGSARRLPAERAKLRLLVSN